MSNEEFQKLVLKRFDDLEKKFEDGQNEIKDMFRDLEAINADRHRILFNNVEELKESNKSIHEIIGKNEVDIGYFCPTPRKGALQFMVFSISYFTTL